MKKFTFFFVFVSGLSSSTICFGQIGALDPSFGDGGKVLTYGISYTSGANAMALQKDGKIVLAGYSYNGVNDDFAVIRYNPDGSVDSSFGIGGEDTSSFSAGDDHAQAIAIQGDGKIILAGHSKVYSNIIISLERFNASGLIDTTFGTKGKVSYMFNGKDDEVNSVIALQDGKILVAGWSVNNTFYNTALIRFNSNGSVDSSFGSNGHVLTLEYGASYSLAAVLQPDNKIIAAGGVVNSHNIFASLSYDSTGRVDSTFGKNGLAQTDVTGFISNVNSIALFPDGKIIEAGYASDGTKDHFALVCLTSNGVIDSAFGKNGIVTTTVGNIDDEIKAVCVDSNKRIIAEGFSKFGTSYDFSLARYDSLGKVDSTFGLNGIVTTAFGGATTYGYAGLLQPDGKILAAGSATVGSKGLFAMARYLVTIPLGVVDLQTQNNSLIVYPDPVLNNATLKYTLTNDEEITLKVYDIYGRLAKQIFSGETRIKGEHEEPLDLASLPSGYYIVSLANKDSQHLSVKIFKQ